MNLATDLVKTTFWQYKAIWCAKQRSSSNMALLARPYGVSLAGHDALDAANDVAWRVAA